MLAALARYKRLLRPNGKIVLIEMNGRCPYWRMMTWVNKNEIRAWYDEFHRLNTNTVQAMLQDAGLKLRQITHFAFIPNGVGQVAVSMLKPLDAVLHQLPIIRNFAMRVAVVAENV